MKHPCSLCGSRDWPSEDSECPLCYESADEPVEDFEEAEELEVNSTIEQFLVKQSARLPADFFSRFTSRLLDPQLFKPAKWPQSMGSL